MAAEPEVIVAGHVCLDIIPQAVPQTHSLDAALEPGTLHAIGPAVLAAGGAVANTGLALDRLGLSVRLMGKVGRDQVGSTVRQLLAHRAPEAAEGMLIDPSGTTSYSIVFSQPGVDRTFWHHSGANDTFAARDVATTWLDRVRLFHFGYPPLMRLMYSDGGRELATMLRTARERGCTTSLDMALPDPSSDASHVDWSAVLERALPHTDIFAPSLDELLVLLRRETRQSSPMSPTERPHPELLADLAGQCLRMGARVVMIKLGASGAYVRTAGYQAISRMGRATPRCAGRWADRELWASCFDADVVGTTGAGDTTVAGFLAGLLRGQDLEGALTSAVAVGACSVEASDALSGIRSWDTTQARIAAGWRRLPLELPTPWRRDARTGLWKGPSDAEDRGAGSKASRVPGARDALGSADGGEMSGTSRGSAAAPLDTAMRLDQA